jgi:hypothetical protein
MKWKVSWRRPRPKIGLKSHREKKNLLNYKNGSSQTNHAGQIIVQAGQNLMSHWNYYIFLANFDEVYLFKHFLLVII